MTQPFGFWRSGTAVFDPATLTLNGWWRADYASSPWVGVASAGSSGTAGRDLTEATNAPSTGAAQNGKTPADFDGTNDILGGANLSTYCNAGAGSVWVLFRADTSVAAAAAGSPFADPFLVGQLGGSVTMCLSYALPGGPGSETFRAGIYDGVSWKEVSIAQATGAYCLAQMKWNGTNLYARKNSGAWSNIACGNVDTMAVAITVGQDYAASQYFDGRILEIGMAPSALSDANFTSIVSYVNSRYGLSL